MGVKNRFLDERLKRGYKFQKDFAKYLGLPENQYSRYENNINQPSVEILYWIAKKLNCHMEDLLYEEEQ